MTKETLNTQKEGILGFAPDYVISLVKTQPEVNSSIAKARLAELTADKVKFRMRYNCWVVDQYAQLCGRSKGHITNMTLQPQLEEGQVTVAINHCYPYPGNTQGPKFIVRDEKSMAYLLSCI